MIGFKAFATSLAIFVVAWLESSHAFEAGSASNESGDSADLKKSSFDRSLKAIAFNGKCPKENNCGDDMKGTLVHQKRRNGRVCITGCFRRIRTSIMRYRRFQCGGCPVAAKTPSKAPALPPSPNATLTVPTPTVAPAPSPTTGPELAPTDIPKARQSTVPLSSIPSAGVPSINPSENPMTLPSDTPTAAPTVEPTVKSASMPTFKPAAKPTLKPTTKPSGAPENPIVTYINKVTLSGRKLSVNGNTAEEMALKFVAVDDKLRLNPSKRYEAFRLRNRYTLLTFWYQQTPTSKWTDGLEKDWLSDSECDWASVLCEDGSIYSLSSTNGNWVGTISAEIGLLTDLYYLRTIGSRKMVGTIPPSMANLTYLIDLDLAENKMTGTLPSFIGNWPRMERFSVAGNHFTGTIPSSIATRWPRIQTAYFQRTNFTGPVPFVIGKCPSVQTLADSKNPCECCED